jgi:hypothetical protein
MAPPPGIDPEQGHPGRIEQNQAVKQAARGADQGQRFGHRRRYGLDDDVNAEVQTGTQAVTHAQNDQPGKSRGVVFQRPRPAGIESVAGDHLEK